MGEEIVTVDLSLRGGYAFEADFHLPGVAPLVLDEPPPLGEGAGPEPRGCWRRAWGTA